MIYFDNAATSPIDKEVFEAMLPYLMEEYGNPSSKYYYKAENAKNAVENAREKVATLVGAKPEEIVFTSGASESTNFIIKGYLDYNKYYGDGRNQVITSNAEHKATINVCKYLNGEIFSNNDYTTSFRNKKNIVNRGFSALFVPINEQGIVSEETFASSITTDTALSSFIYVNNEIGTINNIGRLADIAHEHKLLIHSDITQALGKIEIDVTKLGLDFMSASAHKIYGPKGIGFAFVKKDNYGLSTISAFIHGGEQEEGLRAGTLAVHNIVGFGKAAELAMKNMKKNQIRISELDDYLSFRLQEIKDVSLLIDKPHRLKGILSIYVNNRNFNNERFIKRISDEFAISTGSACSLGEPSHVISALGMQSETTKIIRISLNKYSTKEEIDKFIEVIKKSLSKISGL